jgi:hypothetical protein
MRNLTLKRMKCSVESIVDESEPYLAIPGDGRRKGKLKLALHRASLLDSFRQESPRRQAHPTSYYTVTGMLSIDGGMMVAGDRDLQIVEEIGNERR